MAERFRWSYQEMSSYTILGQVICHVNRLCFQAFVQQVKPLNANTLTFSI